MKTTFQYPPLVSAMVSLLCYLAFLQAAHAETLLLKDGSEIKGTIVDIFPAKNEITLKSTGGRIYTFKYQEIEAYRTKQSQFSASELDSSKNQLVEPPKPANRYAVTLTHSSVNYYLYRNSSDSDSEVKAELDGFDLAMSYFFNNYVSVEAAVYWGETDRLTFGSGKDRAEGNLSTFTDIKSLSTVGGRGAALVGWNIRDAGFRAYIGLGLYGERTKIKQTNQSEITDHIVGTALKFGLGYNWSAVSIDFWGSTRSNQAYGFTDGSSQGGLSMSYRF